jgi:hypothetical protein
MQASVKIRVRYTHGRFSRPPHEQAWENDRVGVAQSVNQFGDQPVDRIGHFKDSGIKPTALPT